jgi:iduronate 2-sulfatase
MQDSAFPRKGPGLPTAFSTRKNVAPFRCRSLLTAFALLLIHNAVANAKDYTVYLLAGQSNMDGRASTSGLPTSPVNLQVPQTDVLYYNGYSGSNGYTSGVWTSLRPGASQFGPEITFGRTMADNHPADAIALVKYARGGTSLAGGWKPGAAGVGGSEYLGFRSTVTSALSSLTSSGNTYHIAGMLWLQGESDTGTNATNYGTNLTNFIADMRSNYGDNLPFVMGGIGYQTADYSIVSAAQESVASRVPNVFYFSDYDLLGPSHTVLHFDAAGQQLIGQRYAAAISAVPEPGTAVLLGAGLGLGLILVCRKRAKSDCPNLSQPEPR